MNLLLLTPEDFCGNQESVIRGRRFEHLKKIVRVEPGQSIEAGLLNGQIGKACVLSMTDDSMRLATQWLQPPPAPMPLTLVLALPRPLMFKRILQTVTTLGVKDIHLIHTQRVEKSYWNSSDLAPEVLEHQLLLGLEQARDTLMPQLHFHRYFQTFMTSVLPGVCEGKRALIAHPGHFAVCPANSKEPLVLAVGPEGGFIDEEITAFTQHGFERVQLGERVLRVEAAVTALLGRLLAL